MTVRRFYAPVIPAVGGALPLPPDEGRHLARVLRLRAGAAIRVFDGAGHENDATVEQDDPRRVIVRVGAPITPPPPPRVPVTLAVTLLKGRKLDDVVRDATALGVAAIVPLVSRRAGAAPGIAGGRHLAARWRGVAIASAKQCGSTIVPQVHAPIAYDTFLADPSAADGHHPLRILLVEPSADNAPDAPWTDAAPLTSLRAGPSPTRAVVTVGPEGGWTRDETSLAIAAGFHPLTLGPRTLRADLAPVVALSILRSVWDDF